MKKLFIFILIISPSALYAKCWGIYELRSVICAQIVVTKKNSDCSAVATVKKMSIPSAHIQDLKKISHIKRDSEVMVKLGAKRCKKTDLGKEYFVMLEGICEDKKGIEPIYSSFLVRDSLKAEVPLGHTGSYGKSESINCKDME